MLLTLDIGNTRTKWAVFSLAGKVTEQGIFLNADLANADFSPPRLGYQRVVISNVAGTAIASLMAQKLATYALPVTFIKSASQACSVSNHYLPRASLGTDRWAALIAAWHLKKAPCIVVNAGTAVTIDALTVDTSNNEGLFLGGLILPGLDLMKTSLGEAAAQLPKINSDNGSANSVTFFATNTAEAIQAGALHAVLGAITRMSTALQKKCGAMPSIVISGGNAPIIAEQLQLTSELGVSVVENLVLQGLYQLDHFMQSELS